jgi:hypothetical protein
MLLMMKTARSGIIVFIAKVTTISAAPMKPMISMFMKFRFRLKVLAMPIAGHPAIGKLVTSMMTVSAESVAKITFSK